MTSHVMHNMHLPILNLGSVSRASIMQGFFLADISHIPQIDHLRCFAFLSLTDIAQHVLNGSSHSLEVFNSVVQEKAV